MVTKTLQPPAPARRSRRRLPKEEASSRTSPRAIPAAERERFAQRSNGERDPRLWECRPNCSRQRLGKERPHVPRARNDGHAYHAQKKLDAAVAHASVRGRLRPGQGSTVFPRVERAEVDASGRVTHHAPKRGSGNRVNERFRRNTGQVGRTIVLNITRFPDIFGAQPTPGAGGDALTPP